MPRFTLVEHRATADPLDALRFGSIAEATAYADAHRLDAAAWRPAIGPDVIERRRHRPEAAARVDPGAVYLMKPFGDLYGRRLFHIEQD